MGNVIRRFFPGQVRPQFRKIEPNHMVDRSIKITHKSHPNSRFSTNFVRTTRYTVLTFLPKNLFEQFHRFANIYFIFVVALNWIPQVQAFAKEVAALPVVFVLLVTAVKDAWEDIRRYRMDKTINNSTCMVYSASENRYVKTEWSKIYPGDFVHISCNAVIPADILFIQSSDVQGICHIETSNIDGESNLKQREVIQGFLPMTESRGFSPTQFTHGVFVEQPNPEIYSFLGYIEKDQQTISLNSSNLLLRGCILRNTDFIEGMVVYAGSETKAIQNNKGPRYKVSKLETKINRDVIWCVILLLFMCFFCAIGSGIWLSDYSNPSIVPFVDFGDDEQYTPLYQGFLVFWTYIIIFQSVIPLPLYVSVELVKLGQIYFITQDVQLYDKETDKPMECRALNITEDLGQIEYIFTDKTGTLTENKMEFKCCCIGGVNYPHASMHDDGDDTHSDYDSRRSFASLSRTSCVMENLYLEPALEREVRSMSLRTLDSSHLVVPLHVCRVHEFFLLMAVCNTVVVTRHKHADVMDESGKIDDSYYSKQQRANMPRTPSKGSPATLNRSLSGARSEKSQSTLSLNSETGSYLHSEEMHYEAESPDELALVRAASTYGCKLMRRGPGKVNVKFPNENGEVVFDILKVLHFDSTRKRMSVIVQHPTSHVITIYAKGADSNIFSVLHPRYQEDKMWSEEFRSTKSHLDSYAKMGLRTLCMAKKVLSKREYLQWEAAHRLAETSLENRDHLIMESACMIEQNLELLGATGIEDRLQDGVPITVSHLREAGIKVWVLTGDKQETAIQIAYAARLFPEDETQEPFIINADDEEGTRAALDRAKRQILAGLGQDAGEPSSADPTAAGSQVSLFSRSVSSVHSLVQGQEQKSYVMVIDGTTLNFATSPALQRLFLSVCKHCHSVVCCRATPIQKATVVKLVRDNLKKMTLAIGDGANDVSMIQTADIGIGISGQEGLQAVMASDFSIAKFCFLERLLLVHGHWNHDRLAKFAAIMFYKSLLSVLVLFWFQIFSGFSGSLMIDSLYLTMQHVIFTAAPPLANGIFDTDLSAETLLDYPSLYKPGQRGQMYTQWTFLIVTLDVIYQSLVIYFLPHLAYAGHSIGLWEFGTTIDVCMILCILLHFCIETRSWVWLQFGAIVLSFTLFWSFLLISNAIFFTFDHPSNPYWVMENTVASASHSAIVVITCFVALLPRLTLRILQVTLFPDEIHKAMQEEKSQKLVASSEEEVPEMGRTVEDDSLGRMSCQHQAADRDTSKRHPGGPWSGSLYHDSLPNQPQAGFTNPKYSTHDQRHGDGWRHQKLANPAFSCEVQVSEHDVRKRGQYTSDMGGSVIT